MYVCSKEEGSNELKVTTNIVKPSTKAILTEFSGSTIGVFVAGTSNSTATVSTGANAVTVSPPISIDASTTVYAYYPATKKDELTSPTSTSTKAIEVLSADDFSATDQTDYLYATPATVTTTNRTAELIFKHALSKVVFKLKKADDFSGAGVLSAISLYSSEKPFLSGTKGKMLIAEGTISDLTATSTLTYKDDTKPITLTADAKEAVALVAPTTLTNNIIITLTIDGDSYPGIFSISDVSAWEAGHAYTYNVTVDKNGGIIIGNVSITDWDTTASETSLDVK